MVEGVHHRAGTEKKTIKNRKFALGVILENFGAFMLRDVTMSEYQSFCISSKKKTENEIQSSPFTLLQVLCSRMPNGTN